MVEPAIAGIAVPKGYSAFLAAAQSTLQVLTILVTATWAYLRYVRGREIKPRVELTVTGKLFFAKDEPYIAVALGVKNIGLWGVTIEQRGTGLLVAACTTPSAPIIDMQWNESSGFHIFTNDTWIAPGESIQDKVAFAVPKDAIAAKLTFIFISRHIAWTAIDFVPIQMPTEKPPVL